MTRTRTLTVVLVAVLLLGGLGPMIAATATANDERLQGTASHDAPVGTPTGDAGLLDGVDAPVLVDDARHVEWVESGVDSVALDATDGFGTNVVARGLDGAPTGLVVFAAYSRYDESDPLENDARREIYEAIVRSPGTYAVRLADSTSSSRSTVRYHVRILESEGLVDAERVQGKRRYFPAATDDVELLAAFNDDATRFVLETMDRVGAVTVTELAGALERAPSTTSYHLSRLAERDLVEQERVDGAVVSRLAPKTERELRRRSVETTGDVAASTSD